MLRTLASHRINQPIQILVTLFRLSFERQILFHGVMLL